MPRADQAREGGKKGRNSFSLVVDGASYVYMRVSSFSSLIWDVAGKAGFRDKRDQISLVFFTDALAASGDGIRMRDRCPGRRRKKRKGLWRGGGWM